MQGRKDKLVMCILFDKARSSMHCIVWVCQYMNVHIPSAKSTALEATATAEPLAAPPAKCLGATGFSATPPRLFLPNMLSHHRRKPFNPFLPGLLEPSKLCPNMARLCFKQGPNCTLYYSLLCILGVNIAHFGSYDSIV